MRHHLVGIAFTCAIITAGAASLLGNAASEPSDDAPRWAEIEPAPAVPRSELLRQLEPLGFKPAGVAPAGGAGSVHGRLPQKSLKPVAELNSVGRLAVGPILAKPAEPIQEYQVRLRFQIQADRQQRYFQYKDMVKQLEAAGFKKDDTSIDDEFFRSRLAGTVAAAGADKLLEESHVRTILLVPASYDLGEDAEIPALVQLQLVSGFGSSRQREIANGTRALLKPLGFVESVGYDHEGHTRLLGRLPAGKLDQLLSDKLLVELPLQESRDPLNIGGSIVVPVQIRFEAPLTGAELRRQLQPLGFEGPPPADERPGGTLNGRMPNWAIAQARRIEGVAKVIPDLSGARERLVSLRRIEVLRADAAERSAKDPEPPKPPPKEVEKVSLDLLAYLANQPEAERQKPLAIEVVLRSTPGDFDRGWPDALRAAPAQMTIDGRIGPLVTGFLVPAKEPAFLDRVRSLAGLSEVSTVRLPQPGRDLVLPPFNDKSPDRLPVKFVALGQQSPQSAGLDKLVQRKNPQRVALVAADFRGYEAFVGKRLPKKTVLIDFTAERNPDLTPAAPVAPEGVGSGTRLALALIEAAPAAELYLLRVDPAAPYQVQEIARAVSGEGWRSEALARRQAEIRLEQERLDYERVELRIERRIVLDNVRDDPDSRAAREAYFKRQKAFDEAEKQLNQKTTRYLRLVERTGQIKDLSTVLLGLHWPDGHPSLPGDYDRFRLLDAKLLGSTAWIQAIPATEGQVWSALFRDADADGVMEFRASETESSDRSDVNSLAWQPYPWLSPADAGVPMVGPKVIYQELPANAVVQVTLQWREVHSVAWKQFTGEDVYRTPLAQPMRIVVLRQRDPAGQRLPNEVFDVVERSAGLADRVENYPRYAIYQVTARFRVTEPGRYAIRIEGQQPDSTLPPGAARAPGSETFELHPKVSVEFVDPAHRPKGRVLFQTYSTSD